MKWLILSLVLTQGADAATTCAALKSGRFVEANPLIGSNASCGRVVALKAATVLPLALIAPRLKNRKLAIVLVLIPTGASGVAVGVNIRRMNK